MVRLSMGADRCLWKPWQKKWVNPLLTGFWVNILKNMPGVSAQLASSKRWLSKIADVI